ncbi:LOW QUALITY PROTEIN: uncharacterized protein ACNLHF_009977 [Anomaloglossus baeobatrachus]
MKNEIDEECSIGLANNSKCHLKTFTHSKDELKLFTSFGLDEQKLLRRRVGLNFDEHSQICLHHEASFLTKYEHLQKSCCNPFGNKGHNTKKNLRAINLLAADQLNEFTKNDVKPGQKMCASCRKEFANRKKSADPVSSESDPDGMECSSESLNSSSTSIGISPLKYPRVSQRDSLGYARRKTSQVQNAFSSKIASIGGLETKDIEETKTAQCKMCLDYNHLLADLKQKLQVSSRAEKVQILTLAPKSWSIKAISDEFGVSDRMVKQARKLKCEHGILALPTIKCGKKVSEEVKKKVQAFFEDDEFSRMCPGKKDYVSVRIAGEKKQMQKRLLLSNMRKMFVAYWDRHGPEIGFSKFCELRPKWCVTVRSAGTHSVCVCTIHQNFKLILAACPINDDYKELICKMVSGIESKDCMLGRCDKCPGPEVLKEFLVNVFVNSDPEDIIEFKQWIHIDRDTLDTKQLTIEDFIEELVDFSKLCSHHYIAKHQSCYLKSLKENLRPGERDFAENYSIIVQDAIQGFHWENSQATVHPFVIYFKELNGEAAQNISLCIISDCSRHDTAAVHTFLTVIVEYLKTLIYGIRHIHYFSDGSGQYKNFKNLLNLCHHNADFNISAEWNFFGTRHGKSPCDGIGGTAKRLAARASLQRPTENQILTLVDLFNFCNEQLHGIKFFFVPKEKIDEIRVVQEERVKDGHTIAGTRENHQFVPIDDKKIHISRVSNDPSSFIAHVDRSVRSEMPFVPIANLQPGQYIACIYDRNWGIGNISEISVDDHDALIHFMHPHGPASFFHWPVRNDTCWIPEQSIIAIIPASGATTMGRQYSFSEPIMLQIQQQFQTT